MGFIPNQRRFEHLRMNNVLHSLKVRRRFFVTLFMALVFIGQTCLAGKPSSIAQCENDLELFNVISIERQKSVTAFHPEIVTNLVAKYKADPEYFKEQEEDFKLRSAYPNQFIAEEGFAIEIYRSDRAKEKWAKFEPISQNVFVSWNKATYDPDTRSRVTGSRHSFFGVNPFSKVYDARFPKPVPLQLEDYVNSGLLEEYTITLFAPPSIDYDVFMTSITDTMAKILDGQNKLYVFQRLFSNTIAMPLAAWELAQFGVHRVQGSLRLKFNKQAPSLVWDRLYVRIFEHDPVQRQQILDHTKWLLDDPTRLAKDSPKLTAEQHKILEEQGVDGFMNYLVKDKGLPEAKQFFKRTLAFVFGVAGLYGLASQVYSDFFVDHLGGKGADLRTKRPDNDSCKAKEIYDAKIKTRDYTPFDDAFIKRFPSTDDRIQNPCDPAGVLAKEFKRLKTEHPDSTKPRDPDFYWKDDSYQKYQQTQDGKDELEKYREVIRQIYFSQKPSPIDVVPTCREYINKCKGGSGAVP
jgi:hypothetical protein